MHINDIKEVLENLDIEERVFVIGALTPLIKDVVSSGRLDIEDLPSFLNNFGFSASEIDIKKIVSNFNKESYAIIKGSLIDKLNAIQGLENFFIFFESTTTTYLNRSKLSYFDKIETIKSPSSSVVIRTLALNLCKVYSEQLKMYFYTKDIKFGSKSSISFDSGYENFVQIWLDSTDASYLLGSNWRNNINTFLDRVTPNVSNFYQIQVAILNPPFNALHIKVIMP
jgi:hypothetical protein